MAERKNFRTRVDRYLRREDTILAQALRKACPLQGQEYRESGEKRALEVLIAAPAALAVTPIIGALALAAKLEDGGSAFYVRNRIGKDGKPVPVVKIRCMREDADQEPWAIIHERNTVQGEVEDPRNTRVGRLMRQYELEELPQLYQVAAGQLALVDFRAVADYAAQHMEEEMGPDRYGEWRRGYGEGRPGLFSLNSAVSNYRKDDMQRDHLDLVYARKASLGLDLFTLYRTGLRMGEKLYNKVGGMFNRDAPEEVHTEYEYVDIARADEL